MLLLFSASLCSNAVSFPCFAPILSVNYVHIFYFSVMFSLMSLVASSSSYIYIDIEQIDIGYRTFADKLQRCSMCISQSYPKFLSHDWRYTKTCLVNLYWSMSRNAQCDWLLNMEEDSSSTLDIEQNEW